MQRRNQRMNRRQGYARRDLRQGDYLLERRLPKFFAMNFVTGEIKTCNDACHAVYFSKGMNKKSHTLHWTACMKTSGAFLMLDMDKKMDYSHVD